MTSSKQTPKTSTYHDLMQACGQTGCPICRVGAHATKRYLKSILNEYVNDIPTRKKLVQSFGFCGEHVQLLLHTRIADTLGVSIVYEHIAKQALRDLPAQFKDAQQMADLFHSFSKRTDDCMVCKSREEVFVRSIQELVRFLDDESVRHILQESDGLCFPHLGKILETTKSKQDAEFLISLTIQKLETRQSEMTEVIRKNNQGTRTEKISDTEALAWKKTMCMITGVSISPTGEAHG